MIRAERLKELNSRSVSRGHYVLYWMQQAQRAYYNHALEFAIERANELNKPLVVFFGVTPKFPRANANHYRFMLEGLRETADELRERGATFLVQPVSSDKGAVALAKSACEVVCDCGYLRIQRRWRERLAKGEAGQGGQVQDDAGGERRRRAGRGGDGEAGILGGGA
jgi:deoxyribodipyrimidine photo-lyase